jgi:hypothetical protein
LRAVPRLPDQVGYRLQDGVVEQRLCYHGKSAGGCRAAAKRRVGCFGDDDCRKPSSGRWKSLKNVQSVGSFRQVMVYHQTASGDAASKIVDQSLCRGEPPPAKAG